MFDPADFRHEPLEAARTVPSRWYVAPEFHDLDRAQVFPRNWQAIAHLSQLTNRGDCITASVADNPVLVVRGKDGQLRAFYNVCRHRGGPLMMHDGNCTMLQCKYHGWTYHLDGSLRGVPRWDRVDLFDKKDYGLVPIRHEVWQDLVWVCLEEPDVPLPTLVDGIAARVSGGGRNLLAGLKFYKRTTYDVHCNWKAYVDNYLEGYHLPHVHPDLCDLLDIQKYVTETAEYHSLQYSPFQPGENLYGAGGGEAYYHFIWPNFMLNIIPGRLQTNRVIPVAADRCQVVFDYFYDDISSPDAKLRAEADIEYAHKVQLEDVEICEYVQRGLTSRAYDRGRFSVECEEGVYHFQSLLKRAYQRIYERQSR
jgi:choline monooxygenase